MDSNISMIGKLVRLPDGTKATVRSVCFTGSYMRIEYLVIWWCGNERREQWIDRDEAVLINEKDCSCVLK